MQFHPKDLSELDELTEEHLGFSALSEGLGFTKATKPTKPTAPAAKSAPLDPFDQPPASRTRDSELQRKAFSGIGAVAAGPARPAPAPTRVAAPTSNVLLEPAAGRLERVAAFSIDFLVIFVPMALGWWISFHEKSWAMFNMDRRSPLALFGLIFAVYFLLSESFGGQSPGKMLLGLGVVEDDKYQKPTGLSHAAKRLFLFVVGASLCGVGLLASFWDPKRRPWHDRYSGSIVRRRA